MAFFCFLLIAENPAKDMDCGQESAPPICQDIVLREYFGMKCDRLLLGYSPDSSAVRSYSRVTDRGILVASDREKSKIEERQWERCIDSSITDFVKRLNRASESLSIRFKDFSNTNQKLLASASEEEDAKLIEEWKDRLKEIEKTANKLRKILADVFASLDRRYVFEVKITPESKQNGYKNEIQLLETAIAQARRQIRDYAMGTQHSVKSEDLQMSMLDYLDQAKTLTKALREAIAD
jgi:hypothetical protein